MEWLCFSRFSLSSSKLVPRSVKLLHFTCESAVWCEYTEHFHCVLASSLKMNFQWKPHICSPPSCRRVAAWRAIIGENIFACIYENHRLLPLLRAISCRNSAWRKSFPFSCFFCMFCFSQQNNDNELIGFMWFSNGIFKNSLLIAEKAHKIRTYYVDYG